MVPVENPAAMVPFFEQLYRHQNGELPGPLKVLQYGDSHTAADEWTGDLRAHFQEMFGDGGSGYAFAGIPYRGYRRFDLRSGATKGWKTEGVMGRSGDGIHGLGGISITADAPREAVYLTVDCQTFELYYLRQPGGGSMQVFDNGTAVDQISTDGEVGPGYYHYEVEPGAHRFEVETLDRAPVRLFGWVAEKATGVTYEALGINGVSATVILNWNANMLQANLEHRNPALIVLAYAAPTKPGKKNWSVESYRDMYIQMIRRLRVAAPAATILVVGPPGSLHSYAHGLDSVGERGEDRGGAARGGVLGRLRVLGHAGEDGRRRIDAAMGAGGHGASRLRAFYGWRLPENRRCCISRSDEPVRHFRQGAAEADQDSRGGELSDAKFVYALQRTTAVAADQRPAIAAHKRIGCGLRAARAVKLDARSGRFIR